jgi:phytoene synthase
MTAPPPQIVDPERALAIAYAPADKRTSLAALFQLDEKLGQIVATTSEPMIGLMRLTWWREALEKLDLADRRTPDEPLLRVLAEQVAPLFVSGGTLAAIEDGWSALIDEEDSERLLLRHGAERGRHLFAAAAAILGADDPRLPSAGAVWALTDLSFHHSSATLSAAARARAAALADDIPPGRWPTAARPLAALFALAVRDSRVGRRVQAAPARLMRMLALRITGR